MKRAAVFDWACARDGCTFVHAWKTPGTTRYCCSACLFQEHVHTNNCGGFGQPVVGVPRWSCARQGCHFVHDWKTHGSTPYCCSGCKRGDPVHTNNCSGKRLPVVGMLGQSIIGVQGLPTGSSHEVIVPGFLASSVRGFHVT